MTKAPAADQAIDVVCRTGLVDTADIARAAGCTPRTVQRWLSHRPAPSRAREARLLELAAVLGQAASRVPGGPGAVTLWLRAPHQKLGWKTPLDAIGDGRFQDAIDAMPAQALDDSAPDAS